MVRDDPADHLSNGGADQNVRREAPLVRSPRETGCCRETVRADNDERLIPVLPADDARERKSSERISRCERLRRRR